MKHHVVVVVEVLVVVVDDTGNGRHSAGSDAGNEKSRS